MIGPRPAIGRILRLAYTSFLKKSTSEPIRRNFDEVIFKEDEAWREVILLTPIYYVFSLRGEIGDSETRHYRWVYLK
jgi:hypothetical protein